MSSVGVGLSEVTGAELVRRFCSDWPGLPPDEIGAFFTPDCAYYQLSLGRPLRGPRAIAGAIEIFRARFEQIESEVRHAADVDGVVLCEREDRFWLPGGRIVGFKAMAKVELKDGKIAVWHDYFDLASLKSQVDVTEA